MSCYLQGCTAQDFTKHEHCYMCGKNTTDYEMRKVCEDADPTNYIVAPVCSTCWGSIDPERQVIIWQKRK